MARVVAMAGPVPFATNGTPVGIQGVMGITVMAEALMHRDGNSPRTIAWCLVDGNFLAMIP